MEFVVCDDHEGLKRAIREVLTEAVWQRCYVHFLRNALDYLPRKADDDCLMELRWLYDRRDLAEVRRDLAVWLDQVEGKYPKLCDWVEENIEETFSFYRLPLAHHKHLKSTNMLERLNQEIKRRTHVVRIFPNAASCLRLVRALAVETHEGWIEATRYLDMQLLKEHKKQALVALDEAADGGRSGATLRYTGLRAAPDHQPANLFAELDAHNCFVSSALPNGAAHAIPEEASGHAGRAASSLRAAGGVSAFAPPADRPGRLPPCL